MQREVVFNGAQKCVFLWGKPFESVLAERRLNLLGARVGTLFVFAAKITKKSASESEDGNIEENVWDTCYGYGCCGIAHRMYKSYFAILLSDWQIAGNGSISCSTFACRYA